MKKRTVIILKVVFVILLALFAAFVVFFAEELLKFRSHRDYLKEPIAQQQVQPWMSFKYVQSRFQVNVEVIIQKKLLLPDMAKPIESYCNSQHLDCVQLVSELEAAKEINFPR